MKTWHKAAQEYSAKGVKLGGIVSKIESEFGLTNMYTAVSSYLYRWRKKQKTESKTKKAIPKITIVQNNVPEEHMGKWDGTEIVRFAVMGDTQFGSTCAQISHLHSFYDLCEKQGIRDVYHTGDITDGLKMRPGHEYELYEHSADGQLEDVVRNYPKRDGITTHFITGNHDASLYKHVGYDIGKAIAKERSDMNYLGRDCAIVYVTPNCTMELRHPWDGTAYSLSYKVQKMAEAMDAETKPNILAVGHYHKQEYLYYRGIHILQTGCFQGQTNFLRGKGISVAMGGWIVAARVDKDGVIQGFCPEWIPYKKAIIDDYKKFYIR